jgi:hypothetical protein
MQIGYATDTIDKFWRSIETKIAMAVERKERMVPPKRGSDVTVLYCLIGTVPLVLFSRLIC